MSALTLACRVCGDLYDLAPGMQHRACPACGTENCRPLAEGEALDKLRRATCLRLDCMFAEAESCYQHVLVECDDEHEALWGKLLCQYGVEFVTDPKTGERCATVHLPRSRPMQLHPDFARACELAPETIRAQYEAEAAYVDAAQAEINRRREQAEPYDVFICHKTTPLTGSGYTEDYNRGVQLARRLEKAGFRVFFAPFSDLEPGANYEAGIYHALWTAKVMLLISSDPAFLTSPWVKSEWSRYLEMLDDGADKHLIPLMYGGLSDARMPKEIRLRGLQSIRMEDFDAAERLMTALARYTGRGAGQAVMEPAPVVKQPKPQPVETALQPAPNQPTQPVNPAPKPVGEGLVPSRSAVQSKSSYAPESHFETEAVEGGVSIKKYTGPGGEVLIPPVIGGKKVVEIRNWAFGPGSFLTSVSIPESVTSIRCSAFAACRDLTSVRIPEGVTSIGENAFVGCSSLTSVHIPASITKLENKVFLDCSALTGITVAAGNKKYYALDGVLMSRDHELVCYPAGLTARIYSVPDGVTSIGAWAFAECSKLASVGIPVSVTSIGSCAFSGCSSLFNVSIPAKTSIGDSAFSGCTNLPFLQKMKLKMMGAM